MVGCPGTHLCRYQGRGCVFDARHYQNDDGPFFQARNKVFTGTREVFPSTAFLPCRILGLKRERETYIRRSRKNSVMLSSVLLRRFLYCLKSSKVRSIGKRPITLSGKGPYHTPVWHYVNPKLATPRTPPKTPAVVYKTAQ